MANDDWTRRVQATTRARATRHGEGYTSRDLDLLTTFVGRNEDLALTLGRTLKAIETAKHSVRAGRAIGSTRVAQSDRPYRGWVEGMGDE